ncbi:MAG: acyltransferase [Candidatus Marinimicrobia bacterium]|nr:acyltransferase [Candidatus Neomarinimicrobiota bacterium]
MLKQFLALLSPTFWMQAVNSLRSFLYGHVRAVRALGKRGRNVTIHPSARLGYPANIFLDDGVGIGSGCHIYAGPNSTISLGSDTLLAPQVFITSDSFGGSPDDLEAVHSGHEADVHIGDRVRIGAHAVILPGVTIGDGAAVGAGSVVTKDIPPHAVAAGNPAKVIKSLQ